jgi:hypothetical protein
VTPTERRGGLRRARLLLWQVLCRGRYDFVYDQMRISMRGMSPKKRLNLAVAGLNLVFRHPRPWSMPLHLQLELTNYCNLCCAVCPTGTGELTRRPQAMSPALAVRVLDEVGPYLLTLTLWGWGESLLHPNLESILQAAARQPAATLLSTNGVCLGEDRVVDALMRFPPTFLIVAIDGLTDDTNSRLRVGARLAPVLNAVRALAEQKARAHQRLPILQMRFIIMKHNQHEVPQLQDFAAAHRFDQVSLRRLSIVATPAGRIAHASLSLDGEGTEPPAVPGRGLRPAFICQQPFWFPSVYADGTLVACEQDCNAEAPMGVIAHGTSFSAVWYGRQAREVRRKVRDAPDTLTCCRNCPACRRPITDTSSRMITINPAVGEPIAIGECP